MAKSSDMKFQKGDVVVAIETSVIYGLYYKGDIGIIEDIWHCEEEGYYYVIPEFNCSVEGYKITHHRVKDSKIAMKLYKNNIRKVEDGWIYLKE